jgi:hypothetical protein
MHGLASWMEIPRWGKPRLLLLNALQKGGYGYLTATDVKRPISMTFAMV